MTASPFRIVSAGECSAPVASYTYASGSARVPQSKRVTDDELEDAHENRSAVYVVTGQAISSTTQYIRGHGTYLDTENSDIVSVVCGTAERVSKLLMVRPIRTRYRPEVGDLVVGRITEVQSRRWKVDIGSQTDASLPLSAINLPGGVQRKKLETDELQMRTFFQEGDLVSAEVQTVAVDGSVTIHTRSLRYGKLRNGALVVMPPPLIRRHASHFVSIMPLPDHGIDLILSLNGLMWVSKHVEYDDAMMHGMSGRIAPDKVYSVYSDVNDRLSKATRGSIALVCMVLASMAHYSIPVIQTDLEHACVWARQHLDMSDPVAFAQGIAKLLMDR